MNATDVNRINVLLSWLLDAPNPSGEIPTSEQAMWAAEYLAHHAHQRWGSGISGDDVKKRWPGRAS